MLTCLIALLVFVPATVYAQTPTPVPGTQITGDQVVIGNTYRLESGETLVGNLLVVGGTATISADSLLNGDVVLIGGTIAIRGTITGDVVSIGGAVTLEDTAVVNGGVTLLGASVNRSPLAKVAGGVSEQSPEVFNFDFGNTDRWNLPFAATEKPLVRVLNTFMQTLAMSVLAVILGLLLPGQIKRVSETVLREPLIAGGVGLLTIIVAPIVLVLLTITIILIPVTILSILVLALGVFFGYVAVGYEIGQRVAVLFKTTWHPSISAGMGVLLLSLVTGFSSYIPCVGWIVGLIVSILGLGAVVISRFGSSKYADRMVQAVLPSAQPPQPPVPPAVTSE